jgi:hypothetical protein
MVSVCLSVCLEVHADRKVSMATAGRAPLALLALYELLYLYPGQVCITESSRIILMWYGMHNRNIIDAIWQLRITE